MIRHGNTLPERSGVALSFCRRPVKKLTPINKPRGLNAPFTCDLHPCHGAGSSWKCERSILP
ncbi:hypothetical protein DOM02_00540 [Pseudomonas aeruginosa]|nr:hypothetical protein DOM02_00540 [Pseudomonas aeruginosa]